jgi:hypothetical protein
MTSLYFVTAQRAWQVVAVVDNLVSKTVLKTGKIEHETEITFFNMKEYDEFKANLEEQWQ